VVRGIAGLLGAVVLVAGVPVALWLAAGWPLPHALPSLGQLRDTLSSSSIPDDFFLNALAVLAWLAWAQFTACLLLEARCALRGRVPRRLPGAGWGIQRLAANLVAAITLLLPSQGVAASTVAAAAPVALVRTVQPPLLSGHDVAREIADHSPDGLAPAPESAREHPRYLVQRRDTLWKIAERHLGDPLRWPEILVLNRDRDQPDGRRLGEDALVHPGWVLRLPHDAVGVLSPDDGEPTAGRGGRVVPLSTSLLGAGLLAAGVVALLRALRVVQQRRRRSGRVIALPDEELVPAEVALRAGERPEQAELLDLALRAMAAGVRRDGIEPPQVLGVTIGPEYLEVLLAAEAATAPEPFGLSPSRRRWRLPVDTPPGRLRDLGRDMASPLPALVTLGLAGEAAVLVNLEAPGLIALRGDQDAARAVLAAFAVELATCRWADFIELILVGFGRDLEPLERVWPVGGVGEVLPWLEQKAAGIAEALEEAGSGSVLAGRLASATGDTWTSAVLLCATPPTREETERLLRLTAVPSRSPVAAVISAERLAGARWSLELPARADQPVHLAPLGLDVVPQRLGAKDYLAVIGLLRSAAKGDVDPAPGQAPPSLSRPPQVRLVDRAEAPEGRVDRETPVEIRVLGRIEVRGIERIDRGKSEELIVFLAFHPDGVDGDQLSEALWPGRPPARGTLNTTTAVARAYLGMTPDGEPRLPHARNGIYRLDPSVGLDWARFQAVAERGYGAGPDGADDRRRALELVRGRPFEGVRPRSYGWAQLDQAPVMESAIVDVADYLAGLLLRAGDVGGAQ
jgi:hypothetical protein